MNVLTDPWPSPSCPPTPFTSPEALALLSPPPPHLRRAKLTGKQALRAKSTNGTFPVVIWAKKMNEVFERFSSSGNVLCTRGNVGSPRSGPTKEYFRRPPPPGGGSPSTGPRVRGPFPWLCHPLSTPLAAPRCERADLYRLPALGSHNGDKLARGVSSKPPPLLPLCGQTLRFGNRLDFFFLQLCVCACVCA